MDQNQEKNNQKEQKQEIIKPESSKKQFWLTLTSVIVIIVLIVLIAVYAKKLPKKENLGEKISNFLKEFAKKSGEETSNEAEFASLKLFDFNNEDDLKLWSEKVQATPYALKPELSIEKNANGSTVLALGIERREVKFSSANWEITKNIGDLSKYVGIEKGAPTSGKMKLNIWLSKDKISLIEYFIGNDPNRWVKYTPDLNSLKDGDWSEIIVDLKNPLQKGEEIDWKTIDWGRIVIFPRSDNVKGTTVYLEDIEITNEK